MLSQTLTIRAYAKINWALELLGRRPDGYHEIRTVTQTVSLCDELVVAVGTAGDAPIGLSVSGLFPAPADATNLCWRAAEGFMAAFGEPGSVDIRLTKSVPAGTGLGGGSSDCAATLVALSHLTGLGTGAQLADLAAALGSDTVLFLRGGAALCSGRGEVVEPLSPAGAVGRHLAIARPDVHVSTREAYAALGPEDFSDGSRVARLTDALQGGSPAGDLGLLLHNAFRPGVARRHPQIAGLIVEALRLGAVACEMTGSGSGVFALVEGASEAACLAGELQRRGYWSVAAQTVDHGNEIAEVKQTD